MTDTLNGWLKEWNDLEFFSRQGNDPEHNKAKYKVRNDWRKILYCLNEAVKDNEQREIPAKCLRFYEWARMRGFDPGLEADTEGDTPEQYWNAALDVIEGRGSITKDEQITFLYAALSDLVFHTKRVTRKGFTHKAYWDAFLEAYGNARQILYPNEHPVKKPIDTVHQK